MKLSEFIQETLVEIANGITSANESLIETGAVANPPNIAVRPRGDSKIFGVWNRNSPEMHPIVELIEFDVSIAVEENREKNAKGSLSISIVELGAGGKSLAKTGSESRVKFRVPLIYPQAKL